MSKRTVQMQLQQEIRTYRWRRQMARSPAATAIAAYAPPAAQQLYAFCWYWLK